MNYKNLIHMRNTIERFDDIYHLEILRILKNNNETYTENRNGTFVNLSLLNLKTIDIIEKYITFIENQNKHLNTTEQIKKKYKTRFFEKDNKDNTLNKCNDS